MSLNIPRFDLIEYDNKNQVRQKRKEQNFKITLLFIINLLLLKSFTDYLSNLCSTPRPHKMYIDACFN